MEALSEMGTAGHLGRLPCRQGRFRFCAAWSITRRQAKTAHQNGEPQIGRLSQLPVENRKKPGTKQHDRKNLALLELSKTKQAQLDCEHGAPKEESDPE